MVIPQQIGNLITLPLQDACDLAAILTQRNQRQFDKPSSVIDQSLLRRIFARDNGLFLNDDTASCGSGSTVIRCTDRNRVALLVRGGKGEDV